MQAVAVARRAMNTRFEILLHGEEPAALRAAAEDALNEIERLEARISPFIPTSEISRVNREAGERPVRVSSNVFHLLERARALSRESEGAFDPTVAPLLRRWRVPGGESGLETTPSELARARLLVGIEKVELRASDSTVRFARKGMMFDLGAIGKGYAIDCAVGLLRENGVANAFIHGGTSSVCGLGHPPDGESWRAAIADPRRHAGATGARDRVLVEFGLRGQSLGVSGTGGWSRAVGNGRAPRIIDPRTGDPVSVPVLAAITSSTATDADALSTALLVRGAEWLDRLCCLRPGAQILLATDEGIDIRPRSHEGDMGR